MGVIAKTVQWVGRLLHTDALPSVEAAPAPRPYSEARAIAAKMQPSNSWQVIDFSINLGVSPCNHTCMFCPQSVQKPAKARWLDLGLLRKVLQEMPEEGVQIGLSSYSETIAAPNLLNAVRLMKEVRPKLRIAMASNGTFFREQLFSDLMDAGLDHYSYSFDAATREDYAKLMQKDDFDLVWTNLEKLVELRNQKKSKMQITTHIMAFEGREADFEKFKAYWHTKVDFVQWRTVGNWGGDNWGLDKRMATAGFIGHRRNAIHVFPLCITSNCNGTATTIRVWLRCRTTKKTLRTTVCPTWGMPLRSPGQMPGNDWTRCAKLMRKGGGVSMSAAGRATSGASTTTSGKSRLAPTVRACSR